MSYLYVFHYIKLIQSFIKQQQSVTYLRWFNINCQAPLDGKISSGSNSVQRQHIENDHQSFEKAYLEHKWNKSTQTKCVLKCALTKNVIAQQP